MGLTAKSTGLGAVDRGLTIERAEIDDLVVALAGNPNVGKSTVFNELTGLRQHTGNWPGKTVTNAQGRAVHKGKGYILVDIPGTYSLLAHSAEEEVARDFICFGEPDAVVVVCDATCLERNMNLVLQTLEITDRVVVCVNLMDEARRKNIRIDCGQLAENLGIPVVGASARSRKGLTELMDQVEATVSQKERRETVKVRYTKPIEDAIALLEPVVAEKLGKRLNARWISLKLLDQEPSLVQSLTEYLEEDLREDPLVAEKLEEARERLRRSGISPEKMKDDIVSCLVMTAEHVCGDVVSFGRSNYSAWDRRLDKILTSRWTGIPVMLLLLAAIFWLTITGANYPSQWLSDGLFWLGDRLGDFLLWCGAPSWLYGALIQGVYRVLAWVVSVMLPPITRFKKNLTVYFLLEIG